MRQNQSRTFVTAVMAGLLVLCSTADLLAAQQREEPVRPQRQDGAQSASWVDEAIAELKAQIAKQQEAIDKLTSVVMKQQDLLNAQAPDVTRVASLTPILGSAASAILAPQTNAGTSEQVLQQYTSKVDDLTRKVDGALGGIAGFKFSGDFRLRADAQLRSGNAIAGPLQNVRSRYRLRLNADKELDPKFKVHVQLSTGPANNGITNDQDMAGTIVKHPFSIAEAYIDFRPNSWLSLRGGRMEEAFADNMRFLFDDDVRFNGFQQILAIPFGSNKAGFKSIEFRSGEYFLTNPNAPVLAASSPLIGAGYRAGQKVRDANLFHPGFVLKQDLGKIWTHQLGADFQYYRNEDQIQLAATAAGAPVLVNGTVGVTLSGPITGIGNATTAAGGSIFNASRFQVARATYRVQHKGIRVGAREMPLYFDFQAARNTGTSGQRDAVMGSVNFGAIRNTGDVRALYQFGLKQANSLISQFTDDDFGTGTGVNLRVHSMRFDVALTRFLQWQNILFIQHEISRSNPGQQFFVPLEAGANTTYRYLGQLNFSF